MTKKKPELPEVPPETEAQRNDPDFVTAVARGFAILRCFKRGERALGNKDLATRTGMPRSTIARLTHTLTELGYLDFQPSIEKYSLGLAVVQFSVNYLAGLDVREIARPLMQQLATDMRATVTLAAPQAEHMVFLEVVHGNPTFALRVGVGERVPRGTTAVGRACLAAFDAAERERLMAAAQKAVRKDDWPLVKRDYEAAFRDYARHGLCLSLGDWNKDVHAVSVPMLSGDGRRVMAFSCSVPARQLAKDQLISEVGPRLMQLRDRVNQALGGQF
ncbi:IclR family transcriptional regulator [Aquincola sp. S2]|uniref:IclR family transcriptional regulator n=1 Tax=Pseudaquabacterium terrae TaxID=2732868 RepID=A0ABX2EJB8_9BURK|nr:IclR family transcriptional regulator [Aquabacterium terrae]NRF68720.1 IclR family transcriptional regulator [Aquabacterium terrae]